MIGDYHAMLQRQVSFIRNRETRRQLGVFHPWKTWSGANCQVANGMGRELDHPNYGS
jgi:hypothetical protein